MEINYRNYSLEELYDVLNHINGEKYPDRLLEIKAEIKRKETDPELKKEMDRKLEELRYSTFWRRFFALWIDGLILIPFHFLMDWLLTMVGGTLGLIFIVSYLGSTIAYFYTIIMHAHGGQTVGKMALNVKVIDKSETNNLSLNQAITRDIVPIILITIAYLFLYPTLTGSLDYQPTGFVEVALVVVGVLNMLWALTEILTMLSNDKRRALHDYIAGSVVVRT